MLRQCAPGAGRASARRQRDLIVRIDQAQAPIVRMNKPTSASTFDPESGATGAGAGVVAVGGIVARAKALTLAEQMTSAPPPLAEPLH